MQIFHYMNFLTSKATPAYKVKILQCRKEADFFDEPGDPGRQRVRQRQAGDRRVRRVKNYNGHFVGELVNAEQCLMRLALQHCSIAMFIILLRALNHL